MGLATLVLLGSACSHTSGNPSVRSGDAGTVSQSERTLRYGYGPERNSAFVYQPDVVLIDGGPQAIRSVSSDGLVWTMANSAGGVRDLAVGKIIFASSDAAGRVLRLERNGDETNVTLTPVRLTDIVRDGHITFDQDIQLDALSFQGPEDLPGAYEGEGDLSGKATPTPPDSLPHALRSGAGPSTVILPALRLLAAQDGGLPGPSPEKGNLTKSKKFGPWNVTAYKTAGTLGLKVDRSAAGDGLKILLDAHLNIESLHARADIPIRAGEVGHSGFQLTGVTGLGASLEGGAGNGSADNRKVKIEFPVELKARVIVGGFPATFVQKFKFLVETAFSAKDGNLKAAGTWSVDGPLGFAGNSLLTPKISQQSSLVESLSGVSVGINAVVTAISFEFGLLVGLPVAGAGPYFRLITSLTLLNGSDLGIIKCRQTTFTATLSGGVQITIFAPVKQAINKLIDFLTPPANKGKNAIPEEKQLTTREFISSKSYRPMIPACAFS